MAWVVLYHPEAEVERGQLPSRERVALDNAVEKLKALGINLEPPHSSAIHGAHNLRELRPRRGNSPWRAFYRRIGQAIVIGSVGPEAEVHKRGFDRAVEAAVERLDDLVE